MVPADDPRSGGRDRAPPPPTRSGRRKQVEDMRLLRWSAPAAARVQLSADFDFFNKAPRPRTSSIPKAACCARSPDPRRAEHDRRTITPGHRSTTMLPEQPARTAAGGWAAERTRPRRPRRPTNYEDLPARPRPRCRGVAAGQPHLSVAVLVDGIILHLRNTRAELAYTDPQGAARPHRHHLVRSAMIG